MRSDFDSVRQPEEQIAILTEANKRLHDEAEVADSLILTLQEEVKTLTQERDEAIFVKNDIIEFSAREILNLRESVGKDIERLTAERNEARKELEQWRKRADWLGACYKDRTLAGGRVVIVLDGTKTATHPDGADVVAGWIDAAMEGSAGLPEGLEFSKKKIDRLTSELAEFRKAPGIEVLEQLNSRDGTKFYSWSQIEFGRVYKGVLRSGELVYSYGYEHFEWYDTGSGTRIRSVEKSRDMLDVFSQRKFHLNDFESLTLTEAINPKQSAT